MKLLEIYDPVGFAISRDGNKTKVRKSFYIANQYKYASPFFVIEADAWKWWNNRYAKSNIAKSTLTLYEIVNEANEKSEDKYKDYVQRILGVE